jgi:lactoylglutathione lyase
VRGVDYVILYVSDLHRAVSFYRDVIGLAFKFARDEYAEFDGGGVKLGLFPAAIVPELIGRERAPGPEGEIVVIVEDVDGEADRLRAAGVEILSDPTDRPWGHRTLHVADPDGHVVELAQEIARPTEPV